MKNILKSIIEKYIHVKVNGSGILIGSCGIMSSICCFVSSFLLSIL